MTGKQLKMFPMKQFIITELNWYRRKGHCPDLLSLSFNYMYLSIYLSIYLFIYLILSSRYSEATKARQRLMIFVYVMRYLRRVPRDWETVKTVSHETVHRNRIKLVARLKQSEMFNNSVYSRLGNNQKCLITLYIAGWVIIKNSTELSQSTRTRVQVYQYTLQAFMCKFMHILKEN